MPEDKINFNCIEIRKMVLSDDFSSFDCSKNDELGCNEFIHREDEAKLFQKERQGITYLFFYRETMVGYVTLAMSSIQAKRIDKRFRKPIRLRNYPSLLIGRLAVDNEWRDRGIGTYIIDWCIGLALELSEQVGCRYVVLETNDKIAKWYSSKCNFSRAKEIVGEKARHFWMYKRLML